MQTEGMPLCREDQSLQFAHWTGKPDYFGCVAGFCVLLQHRRVKGRDAGEEGGWKRVRLAQSGGT